MNITAVDKNGVKVVSIEGDLDTSTSPKAQEMLSEFVAKGAAKMVIDLEDMNYISSAGLRVLLVLAKQTAAAGGQLSICGLNEMATEVFDISGFSSILSIFTTKDEALQGF